MFMALAVGLVTTTATILASAGHGGPHGDGPNGKRPFAALDLTDAQKEQLKTLHEQFKASHESQFEQMKALHEQMRAQRKGGDEQGAKATREKIKDLRESLQADRKALHEQVKAVLTDAQKAKLEEMKANRGDCKGKHKGKRGKKGKGDAEIGNTKPGID